MIQDIQVCLTPPTSHVMLLVFLWHGSSIMESRSGHLNHVLSYSLGSTTRNGHLDACAELLAGI